MMPRFWHMPLLRNIDKSQNFEAQESGVAGVLPRRRDSCRGAMLNFLGLMGGGMPPRRPTRPMPVGDLRRWTKMLEQFQVATGFRWAGRCSTWSS